MSPSDLVTLAACGIGVAFFVAGTLGLIRFPDTPSRLHALTKADNLGLGLIVFGLSFQAGSVAVVFKLLLVWAFAMLAAATTAQLVARITAPDTLPTPDEGDRP